MLASRDLVILSWMIDRVKAHRIKHDGQSIQTAFPFLHPVVRCFLGLYGISPPRCMLGHK